MSYGRKPAALCFSFTGHTEGPGSTLAAAAAKSLQLCPTLYGPIDGSPPGSPVPGILQARTLELGAIAFSNRNLKEGKIVLIFFVLFHIMLSPCMFFPVSVHSTDT